MLFQIDKISEIILKIKKAFSLLHSYCKTKAYLLKATYMNFNNYTIKAQEAVQKASEIALGNQQQAIEPAHILKALLTVDENVISHLLKKLNVNINLLSSEVDKQIEALPKVSGSNVYIGNATASVLQKAQSYLK